MIIDFILLRFIQAVSIDYIVFIVSGMFIFASIYTVYKLSV